MQGEDQENDSNGIVEDDGPLSSSSSPRPNVELDTTAPTMVEVLQPNEGQESDSDLSPDSPRVTSRYL